MNHTTHNSTFDELIKFSFIVMVFIFFFSSAQLAFADSIAIGGSDNSAQMKDVQNLMTTIQIIGFKWVAKIIGGFLVIAGVYKIASRDFMNGILSTAGGGTLFFVEKIADSLSKMSGT